MTFQRPKRAGRKQRGFHETRLGGESLRQRGIAHSPVITDRPRLAGGTGTLQTQPVSWNKDSVGVLAIKTLQPCLLFFKIKFKLDKLVFYGVHVILQFVELVEDHHPLIGL